MAHRWWGMVFALTTLVAPSAAAQVRTVSGAVTNAQTGQGVPEATISVQGTRIVAQTGPDGRYSLNAPDDTLVMVVRAIGFRSRTDTLDMGIDTRDVSLELEPDIFKLEEVVVTGQSTGIERQNLPNAVATVSGSELTRAPTGTLESALQGKIPGALIQANSGAPARRRLPSPSRSLRARRRGRGCSG